MVQGFIGSKASAVLEEILDTEVQIGRVDIRLPNRIIIDDVCVYDQQRKDMLRVSRLSAAVDILPLLDGRISFSSAQLFGMKAKLYRQNAASPLNCQFMIDALSSKDTTESAPLDLSIASLIVRNGSIQYDQYGVPPTREKFSPAHVNISKLSSHIILYKVTDDSLNVSCHRLSLNEASGIQIKNFKTDIRIGKGSIDIRNLKLEMPGTSFGIPAFKTTYAMSGDSILPGSLRFSGKIAANSITPSDFRALLPENILYTLPVIELDAAAEGTDKKASATLSLHSVGTDELAIQTSAEASDLLLHPSGEALLSKLFISESLINAVSSIVSIPEQLKRIGATDVKGRFRMNPDKRITANADIITSKAGKLAVNADIDSNYIKGKIETPSLNIAQILDDKRFGELQCSLDILAHKSQNGGLSAASLKGKIGAVTYNDYTYHDIIVDAEYGNNVARGMIDINDPNVRLTANGNMSLGRMKGLNATVTLNDFSPLALNLTNKFGHDVFALQLNANMAGTSIDNATGTIELTDVSVTNAVEEKPDAYINSLSLTSLDNKEEGKEVRLNSDFADIALKGRIKLTQIPQSFMNLLAKEVTTVEGLNTREGIDNNFTVDAKIRNIAFIKRLIDIPVDFEKPVTVNGFINSFEDKANIRVYAPDLNISGTMLSGTDIQMWTPENSLKTTLTTYLHEENDKVRFNIESTADDNDIYSVFSWDNMRSSTFRGSINMMTQFTQSLDGTSSVQLNIPQSTFEVGDSLWTLRSQGINYSNGVLVIDHLSVGNSTQYVSIDGVASDSPNDSLVANLYNINVGYIMNLINFHSVEFNGNASGTAAAHALFGDISAMAHLDVSEFLFEEGRMGTLHVDATYSNATEQIDIDAIADDPSGNAETLIAGYISPQRNTIDLGIEAKNTRLEFMETFCSSFLKDTDLHGTGKVRLHGLLSAINLEGKVVADGDITLTPTNCRYTLEHDTVTFVPDDILFDSAPLKDKFGNTAYLSGGIHHKNLAKMSYDLTARADKLLAYDFPTLDGSSFCGHAIIRGNVGIHGKGNELEISADATPLSGSYIIYNASSPDAIASQDFITWGSATAKAAAIDSTSHNKAKTDDETILYAGNDRTNIRMNFMVNMTPDARLHLLMDAATGDYIDLFGNGVLRVSYYNKGAFEIFGNYAVDHGTYKMTIQNLIRKDFAFLKGGTIAFGGDPYDAVVQMQAQYSLASVSLADLNIGSSFKSNNVPVNCLMNITGTPGNPNVEFSLDLPSLSSDARQMVYSIINSDEEMTQQVLYLLAIGRFYSQPSNNNNDTERMGQTSLAMQSFLSGTLSQQFNHMMSQVIGNRQWSFGANIAPGNDGFNNAEYEGLLSGKLFNNRLLFNGQFGYRDNISTNTQSFIGDFTLQYLLTPNGVVSLKVYNQTNDRYFTRNSLNTQGIGIVFQKEFGK